MWDVIADAMIVTSQVIIAVGVTFIAVKMWIQ